MGNGTPQDLEQGSNKDSLFRMNPLATNAEEGMGGGATGEESEEGYPFGHKELHQVTLIGDDIALSRSVNCTYQYM